LLVSLAWARAAAADEDLELSWDAPPGCPDVQQVAADIGRLTRGTAAPMVVAGTVSRDDAGQWAVDLAITRAGGVPGQRRVEGGSCREVTDAAAVIVALARGAPSPPPPPPPPPPAVVQAPAPPPPRRLRWGVAAVGGIDAAALPAPTPGLGLAASLAAGRNRFELQATAWRSQDAALTPSSGAHVALYAGAARYCRVLAGDRLAFAACAGVEGGALRAAGFGLRTNQSGLARWLATNGSLLLLFDASAHLQLVVEAGGLVALIRDQLVVDGAVVYRPRQAGGRGLAGLRLQWP
jgi:hypothetical protein